MKRFLWGLMVLTMLVLPVWAEEAGTSAAYQEIESVEDLLAIQDAPNGAYVLMADLDLTGVQWPCPDFSGKLDGNGHSLLNLTVSAPGESTAQVLDGNQKPYEACFAGLFGQLTNAEIRNLNLVNLRLLVETDEPCMAGGIAGYSMDSKIIDCSVSGTLELRAHEGMFGLAGMVGYGVASVSKCRVDTTLICVDTDGENPDEQFLGGVFGTGFVGVEKTEVALDAYISEHGFVHSGGIGGMLLQYPIGMGREAYIKDNTITGKITFFEHNPIRRAYCKATIGELLEALNYNYGFSGNHTEGVQKEETKEYDRELRPETCGAPTYVEEVIPASCDAFGYTQYTCQSCGYSYRDHFTLHSHTVTEWKPVKAATTTRTGLSEGTCSLCGLRQQREDPILPEPEPEPETTAPLTEQTEPQTIPEPTPAARREIPRGIWVLCGILAVAAIACLIFFLTEPKGKHVKKK